MALFKFDLPGPVEHDPPDHLGDESSQFWKDVCRLFFLEAHHLKLLESACDCWDTILDCRKQIAEDGPFIRDRYKQVKPHPGLNIMRDNKILLARLIRELQLDVDLGDQPPRLY